MTYGSAFTQTLLATLGSTVLAGGAMVGLPAVFAAANTVGNSQVGDGTSSVSGYTVSAVHYTLNASNPVNIDAVAFTLNATPLVGSTIKVRLVSSGSDWYSCSNVATAVTCTTTSPQATAAAANELRVVIAD